MGTSMKAKRYKPHGDYNENIAIMTTEDLKKIKNLPDGISDIRYINVDNKKNTMERRQVCAKVVIYEKSLEVPLSENQIYLEGRTLFDHLLINEGDEVYVDALYNEDITCAKEIKIELVNPNEIEGWTEDKIQEAKYRIISSEIVLFTGNLFWLFASNCKPTLCRVVETVPNESCIKADQQTIIAFVNLPKLASDINITFKDIGGLKEQIIKIREMIQLPLEKPEIFKTLGIEPPKGIILYGPPGTGKTLLAKALSNEINANFQSIRGPEVLTKWAGEGEKKLREIFETARQNIPSIIFFDEIDSIAPSRDEAEGMISIRLVSQILDLMDGLVSRGKVFVIAATNRIYAIDPALRRPGRFDREIEIPVPDVDGRKIILSIYLNKMKIDCSIDSEELAKMTSGYTGADIASLCKEAGMKTLRRVVSFDDNGEIIQYDEHLAVNRDDFLEAFKEIVPSTLRTIETEKNDILLNDIVGMEPAKNKISQIFNYAFSDKRAQDRKNSRFILEGPPGSGKSSILNSFANEYNLRIITLTPIDIMLDYYKEIGKVLKNAFLKAIQASPSILLFDHLDSIFSCDKQLSKIERFIIDAIIQESQHLNTFKNVVIVATAYNAERIPLLLKSYNGFSELINIQPPDDLERECIIRKIIPADGDKIKKLIKNTQGLFYNEIVSFCDGDNA